jgi:hypothetical protein
MINEIGAAISALSGIKAIADGQRAGLDESDLLAVKFDLTGLVCEVQQALLAHQQAIAALIQEKEKIVEGLKQAKEVEADLRGYELAEIAAGSFVLASQPDANGLRRAPYFCPACRQDGKKSVLNFQGGVQVLQSYLVCPRDDAHRIALPHGRLTTAHLGLPPEQSA